MKRRTFLASALAAAVRPRRRILLRSSWQVVNIGDIAHTPGALALLERYVPDAEVRLWPSSVEGGVEEMLLRRFPKLQIVKGEEQIRQAMTECDFLLHGSGASLVAQADVVRWLRETGKPYGIYGITLAAVSPAIRDLLGTAKFTFFRDSVSLDLARSQGVTCPVMEFGPDAAFAADVRNDAAAKEFLTINGLQEGRFLCCIPRYRQTPYWKLSSRQRPFDEARDARNQAMKEHDHAPLREAITALVRQTSMRILICPEDETQVEIGREMLYDRLPESVRAEVVWRNRFWLADEAISTYARSAGVFGNEMHSPIMAIGNGVPAIVCRWAEQTSKGFMWRDIGLGDWLFDLDNAADPARVAPAVVAMARDPRTARLKAAAARRRVEEYQRKTMKVVAETVAASGGNGAAAKSAGY